MAVHAAPLSAADADVKATEVAPRASDSPLGADWLELTSTGATQVDLAGWRIVPVDLQIGWAPVVGMTLSDSGDEVNVFDSAGAVVANVSDGPVAASTEPHPTLDNTAARPAATPRSRAG